jgi:hypothetical protein
MVQHLIKSGESFHDICHKYQISLAHLLCFNSELFIYNQINSIVGKKILIPPKNLPLPHRVNVLKMDEY